MLTSCSWLNGKRGRADNKQNDDWYERDLCTEESRGRYFQPSKVRLDVFNDHSALLIVSIAEIFSG